LRRWGLRGAVAKLISARQRLAQPWLRDKRYRPKKSQPGAGPLTVEVPNATGKLGCKVSLRVGRSTILELEVSPMTQIVHSRSMCTRREMMKASGLAAIPLLVPIWANSSLEQEPMTANGGSDPYPIPWLDKNGSDNQPAGPNLEPSHIYHFKGRVARCRTFTGMGTDNKGNRIAFGSPTTDYGVMMGEYWGARTKQNGTFTHI
jgi:hypothetical protein